MTRAAFKYGSVIFTAALLAPGACSKGRGPAKVVTPPKPVVLVQPGACPTTTEPVDDKIVGAAALEAAHQRVPVEVLLRAASLPDVPACPDGAQPERTCRARDAALADRRFLNSQQLTCVQLALGPVLSNFVPDWYERPFHTTLGESVPVALGFTGMLSWSEIQRVAAHPFVERVAAQPGAVPRLGGPVPAASDECPGADADDPAPESKLADADALRAPGRHAARVKLRLDRLPPRASCADPTRCLQAVPAAWDRTMLNTRDVTCVKRRLDQEVQGYEGDVDATILNNDDVSMRPLPPLGQTPFLVESFGVGLTWDEATRVARHPAVLAIAPLPGAALKPPGLPGCPSLDGTDAIPEQACPAERDDGADKVYAPTIPFLQQPGPHEASIMVKGGLMACPVGGCREGPCLEAQAVLEYGKRVGLAQQQCVRALVSAVGGTASDEVFTFTEASAFMAQLTWEQVEIVKTHPQVLSISGNVPAPPP